MQSRRSYLTIESDRYRAQYSNIRDVFTDKNILIDRLANNIPPFSIFNLNNEEKSMRDLTKENANFMWYQLLIDILLRMPNNDKINAKQEMINECRLHYEKNKQQINLIEGFIELEVVRSSRFSTSFRRCFTIHLHQAHSLFNIYFLTPYMVF
jgi:hypothetical protein